MTLNEFQEGIRKLESRFKISRPYSSDAMADMFDEMKRIPSEAWREILKKWWWGEKHMPTPGDLYADWQAWYCKHPEKQAKGETARQWCSDCLGHGGFTVRGPGRQTINGNEVPDTEETWVICSRCNEQKEWKIDGRPVELQRMDLNKLSNARLEIVFPSNNEYEGGEETVRVPEISPSEPGMAHISDNIPF